MAMKSSSLPEAAASPVTAIQIATTAAARSVQPRAAAGLMPARRAAAPAPTARSTATAVTRAMKGAASETGIPLRMGLL